MAFTNNKKLTDFLFNSKYSLLLPFVLFVITKIFYLDNFLWYDEAGWGAELFDFNSLKHTPLNIPHMPLPLVFFKLSTEIFGYSNFALRLVPFLFGIGIFFMLYLVAKKIYDRRTAVISCLVLSISFWPAVAMTTVDQDGAIISFLILLTFYFFIKGIKENSNKYFLLSGIALTLCTLTRIITGLIILAIIFIYLLIETVLNRNNLKNNLVQFLKIALSFVVTSVIILLLLYLQNPAYYSQQYAIPFGLLQQFIAGNSSSFSLTNILLSLSVFLWATPLLLLPLVFKRFERRDLLFYVISIMIFIIFSITLRGGDPARYTSIMIPYLCILCGSWLNQERKNINLKAFAAFLFVFLFLFFAYNVLLPFSPPYNYQQALQDIISNFFSSLFIYGGSSVSPFYISFAIILVVFIASFLALLMKRLSSTNAITIFLSLTVAFNIFLITEYNFSLTQPNVNAVGKEMIEKIRPYIDTSQSLAVDYANYEALEFYFGYPESNLIILNPFNVFFTIYDPVEVSKDLAPKIKGRNVFFIDYLKTPRNEVKQLFDGCFLLESAQSREKTLGYFYSC
jgi:4-amino-4-deoxy-L-arabinose transferase-like glycosyltransferase